MVALVLVVAAVVVVLVQRHQLIANLDGSLEQRADTLFEAVNNDPTAALANSNAEDRFVQLLDADGDLLASTVNLDGRPVPIELPEAVGQRSFTSSDIPLEDDAYRVLVRRTETSAGDRVLVVGENIDDVQDSTRVLAFTFAGLIPIVVMLLAALAWALVGRTLEPVEAIRRNVDAIGIDELDHRVPDPDTGDEISRLASTMNNMLGRLEKSSSLQRQFVADASHELRSPLTRIRSILEVDLAVADVDLRSTADTVLHEAIELQHLVDDLLFIARHDSPSTVVEMRPVDLDVIVDTEVQRARERVSVQIDMSEVSAANLDGSAAQLARLVRNLLSNAVRHAASKVLVRLQETRDVVQLTIDDDGPGIPADDRVRVFERFTRLDDARAMSTGGAGLGLAIAREIALVHRATIEAGESDLGGARLTVTFETP